MLKFTLHVNSSREYDGGFKLSVSADGKEEQQIAQDLTSKLIEKIEKIKVCVGEGGEEE